MTTAEAAAAAVCIRPPPSGSSNRVVGRYLQSPIARLLKSFCLFSRADARANAARAAVEKDIERQRHMQQFLFEEEECGIGGRFDKAGGPQSSYNRVSQWEENRTGHLASADAVPGAMIVQCDKLLAAFVVIVRTTIPFRY